VTADDWLAVALTTEPADRVRAEAGVRTAYQLGGLTPPERFVWCDSPRAGALVAARLAANGEAGASVRAQVRNKAWAAVRAELVDRLGHAGWAEHWAGTGAQNWRLVNDALVTPVRRRLSAELAAADGGPDPALVMVDALNGQHDAAWLPAFEGAAELAGVAEVARSAGWWWPYERLAVLTERPVGVHRDNLGRLHHGDGPALSYPDGWGLHAWRGMPIPAEVAAQLPHLTAEQIRTEANAEVRRVMLEHFGFERYLRESGAAKAHEDEFGILWRVAMPGDEPLVMVQVLNATPEPDGSRRTYFLRVPPDTRTAKAAVAWTFGVDEEEYAPLVQT
jgi:hypothetical protein